LCSGRRQRTNSWFGVPKMAKKVLQYLFPGVELMNKTKSVALRTLFVLLIPIIVFAQGTPTVGSDASGGTEFSARRFSFGFIGGAALTDAFGHDRTGFIFAADGSIEQVLARSYSTVKDYVIGPALELRLPWRGVAVELNALYRPMNLTMAGVRSDGSLHSISPATVVTWQFPTLAKYTFSFAFINPFIEAGPSFRVAGNLNDAGPSAYGGTAGIGVEAKLWRLRIGPLARYTHWAADSDRAGSRTKRNQVELLLGVSF